MRASIVGYEPEILADVVVASGTARSTSASNCTNPRSDSKAWRSARTTSRRSPDAPVSVQKLSYEEIRRSPGGFEDVIRAISVLPGVAQAQAGRNDLVVRGGAPSENLFTVDNIEIPNINHFGTQGSERRSAELHQSGFRPRDIVLDRRVRGALWRPACRRSSISRLRDGRTDRLGGKATIAATQFGLNLEGPVGSGRARSSSRPVAAIWISSSKRRGSRSCRSTGISSDVLNYRFDDAQRGDVSRRRRDR